MKVKQNLKHSEAVAAGAPPESGVVRLIWDFFWGGSVLLAGLDGNFGAEQMPVVRRVDWGQVLKVKLLKSSWGRLPVPSASTTALLALSGSEARNGLGMVSMGRPKFET